MAQFLGFGSGADGAATLSGTDAPIDSSFPTASAGATSATIATGLSISGNDFVLIHQSRGTGAGTWELIQVDTYTSGTGAITFKTPLANAYTDSGNSQAQLVKVKQYSSVTVSGTLTAKNWDGNVGGIIVFMCSGKTTISGTITGDWKGYGGGYGNDVSGNNGEGTPGWSWYQNPNGSGGGGGTKNNNYAGGGAGGGNGLSGSNGGLSASGNPPQEALGGDQGGSSDLTSMVFGGGGGRGGDQWSVGAAGNGGAGGAIIMIFTNAITVSGTITSNGQGGYSGSSEGGDGGGGAGGSIFIKAYSADVGSSIITATGGSGANHGGSGRYGGNGGTGRIRIEACSIDGTTNPSASELEGGLNFCFVRHGIL